MTTKRINRMIQNKINKLCCVYSYYELMLYYLKCDDILIGSFKLNCINNENTNIDIVIDNILIDILNLKVSISGVGCKYVKILIGLNYQDNSYETFFGDVFIIKLDYDRLVNNLYNIKREIITEIIKINKSKLCLNNNNNNNNLNLQKINFEIIFYN